MADGSKIEWTDATWNPITGCSVVSPGCTNCYAMKLAGTRMKHHWSREGLTEPSKAGPVWNGKVRFNEQWLDLPLRWRKPRRIFVCAHGDLFHESVPDAWIDSVFYIMSLARQHTFQVLTKRAERMQAYLSDPTITDRIFPHVAPFGQPQNATHLVTSWPLANVWLGVSVEDQERADERIPPLLDTPAAVRFVSAEPLLGPVDLECVPRPRNWPPPPDDVSDGIDPLRHVRSHLDWIIAGGESGPNARPMHPDWPRAIRDQCEAADVSFFMKQWGEWAPWEDHPVAAPVCNPIRSLKFPDGQQMVRFGKKAAGAELDGREWREFPGYLNREC